MGTRISVAVVDNHQSILRGVRAILEEHYDEFEFAGCYSHPDELLSAAGPAPAVVILDLWLERDDADASVAIPDLRERGSAVVLYTTEQKPVPLRRAVSAGAMGLALKNDGEDGLLDAVRTVGTGEFACSSELAAALIDDRGRAAKLTEREVEVLDLIADGLTRQQVATRLGIEPATVSSHIENASKRYRALGRKVPNATSLISEARRDGYGATGL